MASRLRLPISGNSGGDSATLLLSDLDPHATASNNPTAPLVPSALPPKSPDLPFTTKYTLPIFNNSSSTKPASSAVPAIVVMGVSGSGKTSVAKVLSETLHCSFLEADDFHSESNKEKMRKGIPLADDDRIPWLEALRDAIRQKLGKGETITVTCSALQKRYREILRSADPDYKTGDYAYCKVKFVCLVAPVEVIAERINRRSKEGEHFMPVSLLKSQLDLLQIYEDEKIPQIDSTTRLQSILDQILALFKDIQD